MNKTNTRSDDTFDEIADNEITECLIGTPPQSFFLFAGAGSGKTRSLVKALEEIKRSKDRQLSLSGHKVGVITYTNKACDEIKRRLDFDELFAVSTVHSFAWSLIQGLNHDIREWLRENLLKTIAELQEKEAKGRPGTKASIDRINKIASTTKRIETLNLVKIFSYSPDGNNPERDDLNHSEVIKISASFLNEKPMMRSLLTNRFPILLIDESQDTNKRLMDALLYVQQQQKDFVLGVIGDTMQRIYTDGKEDLQTNLPDDWKTPAKKMNHRCSTRIVNLINQIRSPVDEQKQRPRSDKNEGFVRLFILPANTENKPEIEQGICSQMADISDDQNWQDSNTHVKTLTLEHHMAAKRLGFLPLWKTLHAEPKLQTGLRDGSLTGLRFFSHRVLPLIKAHQSNDQFALTSILRQQSPLLEKDSLAKLGNNQMDQIKDAQAAVQSFASLWAEESEPSFLEVLQLVGKTNLFDIPESLKSFAKTIQTGIVEDDEKEKEIDKLTAWRNFLETPFNQIQPYSEYIQGESHFDTHQGIKGLEFPRVCVIIDDSEARGFMFSYEKLFGAKPEPLKKTPSADSSTDRTRRLLYVTCSRAEESLAIIAYSENPKAVYDHALKEGWFTKEEIIYM